MEYRAVRQCVWRAHVRADHLRAAACEALAQRAADAAGGAGDHHRLAFDTEPSIEPCIHGRTSSVAFPLT